MWSCDGQGEEGVKQEPAARTYSMSSEGHAADKAALQGFAKTRDAASSPVRPAIDQQPSKVRVVFIHVCRPTFWWLLFIARVLTACITTAR